MARRRIRQGDGIMALAMSLRWLGVRHALPLLFLVAALMVGLSQTRPDEIAALRARVTQGMIPLWQVMRAPTDYATSVGEAFSGMRHAYDENIHLKADNAALLQWRAEAARLAAENVRLHKLQNFVVPAGARALTARVVTDLGSTYQRSLLVLAGFEDGVEVGQVALGAEGVVGRVVEVGPKAARILLLNDVNARLPARLENSGATAIVAGDGTDEPHLLYLPRDVSVVIGERVVTSGHGGIFPAGLPIGVVSGAQGPGGESVTVTPLEDSRALDMVRIVDYRVPTDVAPNEFRVDPSTDSTRKPKKK